MCRDPFVTLSKKVKTFGDAIHRELLAESKRPIDSLSEAHVEELRKQMVANNLYRPSERTERLCIKGKLSDW